MPEAEPIVRAAGRCEARLVGALLLFWSASSAGCGGAPERDSESAWVVPSSPARTTRLERVARGIRARIEAIGESDMHDIVLAEVARLNDEIGGRKTISLTGWSLESFELRNYLAWNIPGPASADGTAFALDFEAENHPLRVILHYARMLAAEGIDLLVVPIPNRLRVYADRLPGVEESDDFPGADVNYAHFLLALTEAGVEVVDLLPAFLAARHDRSGQDDERLFLDHNVHWTPRGAALAAETIAARLRELEWFTDGPAVAGVDFEERLEAALFEVPTRNPLAREPITLWFRRVLDGQGQPAAVRDRQSPILWLGDSFSGWYSEQASDLLRLTYARTGHRMDVIRGDGTGVASGWRSLRRRGDALAGKRVLVWEFNLGLLLGAEIPQVELFGPESER